MHPHPFLRILGRLAIAACCLPGLAPAQGRIIAIGDEWLLSDLAFTSLPQQSTQLAINIGGYFAGGQPGNFLALSSLSAFPPYGSRGVNGGPLATAMRAAGHTWTIDANAAVTLANLSQYDGVFLAGTTASSAADAQALISYVNAGGNVLVMAGTGAPFCGPTCEAAAWNVFLNAFGLGFGSTYFVYAPNSLVPIPVAPSGHALAQGLTTISWGNGQLALDLNPFDPRNQVAVRGQFAGFGNGPQGNVNDIIATFNLGTVSPIYTPFASGCAGSAGIASNTATALPRIGQSMIARIGNLPPPNLVFFVLGVSRTTSAFGPLPLDLGVLGAPGCSLAVSNDFLAALFGSAGSASFTLPIPNDQTFLGLQFFTQGLVVDPGWNPLGAVLSVACEATVGN